MHPPDEADDVTQEAQNYDLGGSHLVIQETPSRTIGGIELVTDAPQLLCNPDFRLNVFCYRGRWPPGSCAKQNQSTRHSSMTKDKTALKLCRNQGTTTTFCIIIITTTTILKALLQF